MIVTTRDLFGLRRVHYHLRTGTSADSIRAVLHESGQTAGAPDHEAIAGYLSGNRSTGRTVLRDVRAVPTGHALLRSPQGLAVQPLAWRARTTDLATALRASLTDVLAGNERVGLALSGGLDSALLLALLRELGLHRQVTSYILATDMPDYCELDAALEIASSQHANVKIVRVTEADFIAALPRTSRAVEEPMFNLHPVAKLLLAEAMATDGIAVAITGDGADQVLRRDRSANYLPLCHALFDSASVALHPPFLDPVVVSHLIGIAPDPHKQCLRDIGRRLALPDRLVYGPKRSRLAPPMDLGALLDQERVSALARALTLSKPALDTDRERVLWTTLSLVLDDLGAATYPD